MIVICPGCSRKYNIKDESIKSEKKVKCTLCGTIWIVKKNVEIETNPKDDSHSKDPVSSFIEKHPESEDLIQKIPQIQDHKKTKKTLFQWKFLILSFLVSFIIVSSFSILFPEHIPFITQNQINILNHTKNTIKKELSNVIQYIESVVFNKKLSIKNVSYKIENDFLTISGEISNTTDREKQIPDLLIAITPKEPLAKTEYMKYKLREKSVKANSIIKFTLKIGEMKKNSVDISIKFKNNNS